MCNSISSDVREQLKWLCLFFTKDRDSFEDCLGENDVVPDKNESDRLKKHLQDKPYSKLILKCYQPTGYHLLQFAINLLLFAMQLVNICYNIADINYSAGYIAS